MLKIELRRETRLWRLHYEGHRLSEGKVLSFSFENVSELSVKSWFLSKIEQQ